MTDPISELRPGAAEPYVYTDARGNTLTAHPRVGLSGATTALCVIAPVGVHIPDVEVDGVARALLAAAGLGQMVVPSPDWPRGRDEVEHWTGVRIKVVRDAVDFGHLAGLDWKAALSLAAHLAYAAYQAREYEQAVPGPVVREIAALVEEVEPDLRELYAQDAPEAIARALVAAGFVKAAQSDAGCVRCDDDDKSRQCFCDGPCWNPDCPQAVRRG